MGLPSGGARVTINCIATPQFATGSRYKGWPCQNLRRAECEELDLKDELDVRGLTHGRIAAGPDRRAER